MWFSGVSVSIQKIDRGNSFPCRRHRVCAYFRDLRPVSMTYPIALHLKDICHWDSRIIKPMLDLQRGAELSKLVLEELIAVVSRIAGPDILL